jgi:regulatory protein
VKTFDLAAAKRQAYRLLAMRPHSEGELERRLRDKGFPDGVIKEALEKLHELKYLNDASFAVQWARNAAVNKLWGNRKISAGLQEKGVAERLIADAIAAVREEWSEEEAIAAFLRKKTPGTKEKLLNRKERQRIFASLIRRGFPPGLIDNQLGTFAEDDIDGEDG